jgi:hypothetical protein
MNNFFQFTDQDRCYDTNGREIPCKSQGHDASQHNVSPEKRLLTSKARFLQEQNLIHDTLSRYTWAKDANLAEFPLTWQEANAFIADLNATAYAGMTNWQLPPRQALFSLISHQNVNPALPRQHPFSNVFPGYYWTSDTCHRLPDQAWYIHLGGGRVFRGMKHGAYLTWPVIVPKRPFQKAPAGRFSITGPLVIDHYIQSTWLFAHRYFEDPLAWDDALQMIHKMNQSNWYGCNHWRLPNIRELESLVDLDRDSPAIFQSFTQSDIKPGYWSSTTSAYEPSYAWVLYTSDGEVGVGFKRKPEFCMVALTDAPLH